MMQLIAIGVEITYAQSCKFSCFSEIQASFY